MINTRAVLEARLGILTGFVCTPKYAIDNRQPGLAAIQDRRWSGWLPFLLLFVAGYYRAGLATLLQEYRDRVRTARRLAALEAAQTP